MLEKDIKNIVSRLILVDIQDPEILEKYPFAGYILFYKDIDHSNNGWIKLKEMNEYYCRTFREKFGVNIFVSVDQEGGVVFRFDYPDFPAICSQAVVSNEQSAYILSKLNGYILKYLGFNLNFSPVMDVNTNTKNPIINIRSFSNDHKVVSLLSKKYIQGYNEANILCTGKHFPGHGDTSKDSHLELPIADLTQEHLYPFFSNKSILPSIMSAHVVYRNIDDLPATLSKKVLDLYQPYEGLVFSDALNMNALKSYEWEEILIKSLQAGVDILLVLGNDELKTKSVEFLSKEFQKNPVFQKLVYSKYQKINKFIDKYTRNFKTSDLLLEEISSMREWMFKEYHIPISYKGELDLFRKKIYSNNHQSIFIFSNPYLRQIGINSQIKNLFEEIFKKKVEVEFVEVNELKEVENIQKSIGDEKLRLNNPILICHLTLDVQHESFISMLKSMGLRVIVISFSNPYVDADLVINVKGFSRVHLLNFKRWVYKFLEGIGGIDIV